MKRLVEFPLVQGGSVLVEVDDPPGCPVMRGIGKDRSEANVKVSMIWRRGAVGG